jgi:excisionase family DNA binding protein
MDTKDKAGPTELLTVPEAAKYLGVGRRVIYSLLERGELSAVRMEGATLIEKGSLEDFRGSGKLT